jgi:hypothetical protein
MQNPVSNPVAAFVRMRKKRDQMVQHAARQQEA